MFFVLGFLVFFSMVLYSFQGVFLCFANFGCFFLGFNRGSFYRVFAEGFFNGCTLLVCELGLYKRWRHLGGHGLVFLGFLCES